MNGSQWHGICHNAKLTKVIVAGISLAQTHVPIENCADKFLMGPTRHWTIVHNFRGNDGRLPVAGVIRDAAGILYGTTATKGASGFGTVFKIDTTGQETVLYRFSGGADGAFPRTDLVRDAAGNLYGTTSGGGSASGSFGNGVVFKLAPADQETVLVTFTGGTDGALPYGGLVRDSAGNLYGTTEFGGASGAGVVFKLVP
jgi:uncharacterized repeat protein (TIGR03803 family)